MTAWTSPADEAVSRENHGSGALARAGLAAAGIGEDMDDTSAAIIDDLTFDLDLDTSGLMVEDRNG